jgi:pimeloyl-ACP methyl ester carboxylesterase
LREYGGVCSFLLVITELTGSGPRVVFVHGSVGNATVGWTGQRALAERFTLAFVTRSGYPPREPAESIDFEEQAAELAGLLEPGDHLVGHSYGGVVSLLAAADAPLRSLVVSEPPAFGVARGDPVVEAYLDTLAAYLADDHTPEEYIGGFLPLVGASPPPGPPSATLLQGAAAAIAERSPSEAEIPLATLRAAPFPKLVVSGGHHPAYDAVCDVLERELGAERAVVVGSGHSVARAPGYNDVLVGFLDRAERSA